MPEPGEFGQPDVVLRQERVHGVVPAGPLVPLAQVGPGGQYPGLPSDLAPLGLRGREVVLGGDRCRNGVNLGLAHGAPFPLNPISAPILAQVGTLLGSATPGAGGPWNGST